MLVKKRAGSQRAADIHPLPWWLMSVSSSKKATDAWNIRFKMMSGARSRRAIPREELAEMLNSSIETPYIKNDTGAPAMILMSGDFKPEDVPDLVPDSDDDTTALGPTSCYSSMDSTCDILIDTRKTWQATTKKIQLHT